MCRLQLTHARHRATLFTSPFLCMTLKLPAHFGVACSSVNRDANLPVDRTCQCFSLFMCFALPPSLAHSLAPSPIRHPSLPAFRPPSLPLSPSLFVSSPSYLFRQMGGFLVVWPSTCVSLGRKGLQGASISVLCCSFCVRVYTHACTGTRRANADTHTHSVDVHEIIPFQKS